MGKLKFIFVLLFVLLLASCGKKVKQPVRHGPVIKIAYLPITHALPVLEAAERSNLNVELVKYGSWPELLDALNTGRVDGASVLIELAMKAKSNGIGLTAVALGHHKGNVIVVSNDIKEPAQLKGKIIAIPHRCSSHYILIREMLDKEHIALNQVNIVEMSPSEMPSALASKSISGYCVAEPFGAIGVANGIGRILYQSDQLWPNSVCCALVFNDKFLHEKPELARSFIKSYHAAAGRLSDKNEALTLLQGMLKQRKDVLEKSLQWIDFKQLRIDSVAYQQLYDKVKAYDIMSDPPEYNAFVRN